MSHTVVRAAAGCGKTTELARRYLGFVAQGIEVERAIAITFTRRAAAELVERVTLTLRGCLPGPVGERARGRLGGAWELYAPVAPKDPELARTALASLPSAPIGTTDRFVHALLTEHALDAEVPIPGADPVPIDVPIRAITGIRGQLERAARRILDPPEGGIDPDVAFLCRYFGLDDILAWMTDGSAYDELPVADTREVMAAMATPLAEALRRHNLNEAWTVPVGADAEGWEAGLRKGTNQSGQWAVPAIAAWMSAGCPAPPPFELGGWLNGLRRNSKARKSIASDLGATRIDLGPAHLSLDDIVRTLRYPYDKLEHVQLADRVQQARERLRRRVLQAGLRRAAEGGELDHRTLTNVAIHLCRTPPKRLIGRYAALLVDEVQDASPEQLGLYRALSALPGDPPLQTVMVGDRRQSIYLFRGAQPAGFSRLVDDALAAGRERVDLATNYRSHPALVVAQKQLFGAIDAPMRGAGHAPIASLAGLESDPANAKLALDPTLHDPPAPVWLVGPEADEQIAFREADQRALHAFLNRVEGAWREAGHRGDTAVVLTPSWRLARLACDRIRSWTGRDDAAFVDGGGAWLSGQVGLDVRMLLRALTDPLDDVAWLALWKHPMVGLTDAALARIRAGVGLEVDGTDGPEPAPGWCRVLGNAIAVDRLLDPHRDDDRQAWSRAVGPLREARARVGRDDLAGILDRLAHQLDWRVLLGAGPGGDDGPAALEVALDFIRDLESEAASPEAVVARLEDRDGGDLPRVHLDRPPQSISCTTVFQAKGLAWDHVCVMSPARSARPWDPEPPRTAWLRLDGQDRRIVGLKFDPTGALSPFKDPVGRLGARVARFRHEEECARLAYVAVTRARRSVTLGVPDDTRGCSGVQKICADVWGSAEFEPTAVVRVPWPVPPQGSRAQTGLPALGLAAPRAHPADARTWYVRRPSSFASHLDVETRRQDAQLVSDRVRLMNGLFLGRASMDPPEEAWPDLSPAQWGDLAHGWMARWGFRGPAVPAHATAWLREAWQVDAPDIGLWLVQISEQLQALGGPLWDVVTDPEAKLFFELPFVGVAGRRDDVVLSGRIDLLVRRGKRHTVIDFKAGGHVPTGWDDLIEGGGLRTYGPQLEAYRAALQTAGRKVDRVGLWFLRTGTQVSW